MKSRISLLNLASRKQLIEQKILYQFSNTMLSTINLGKLTHLILSSLTSASTQLFERAMLFLINDKNGILQGMLGVTRDMTDGLMVIGGADSLDSRWDISDEDIKSQREAGFSKTIRLIRMQSDENCSIIKQTVVEQRLYINEGKECKSCDVCIITKSLEITNFAVVPLVARGKLLGIIILDRHISGKPIKISDTHFLQLIANQAGMAIENSMLYARIEESNASLTDARERLVHGERLAVIGEMAANLAHELKNPLVTIGGFAGRLLKGLDSQSREHQYADTIVKEISRLEKMLVDILAFSRKPTICYSRCVLKTVLEECFASCSTTMEDNKIKLTKLFADGEFETVGDPNQLKQVFINLLLNACEAMPNGGSLHVSIKTSGENPRRLLVEIHDSGGGIDEDMIPKIFNPFFTTKHNGTGLGLSIVNRILQNHYGSIEVKNKAGGALFTVNLPFEEILSE